LRINSASGWFSLQKKYAVVVVVVVVVAAAVVAGVVVVGKITRLQAVCCRVQIPVGMRDFYFL
jgi:hypothetical protein